ncbi:hypothetical protein RHGRI_003207 [Rhododendron griersonianum]|uniref:Uncharacterized protein n=1 Tax=Rhododendron griersonianum TaxID=479676 RepID=A0AAV6L5F1_9ERIC|nr:hypothetical protein RHGRI_003207 [Rhododendron griersonianum]
MISLPVRYVFVSVMYTICVMVGMALGRKVADGLHAVKDKVMSQIHGGASGGVGAGTFIGDTFSSKPTFEQGVAEKMETLDVTLTKISTTTTTISTTGSMLIKRDPKELPHLPLDFRRSERVGNRSARILLIPVAVVEMVVAVFFLFVEENVQATAWGEEGMMLFFVCCNPNCGHHWRD